MLASLNTPLHHRRDVGHHLRLEAGGFLEARTKLADYDLGDARAEDLQLGGVCGTHS